jgi:hypothetical protein
MTDYNYVIFLFNECWGFYDKELACQIAKDNNTVAFDKYGETIS